MLFTLYETLVLPHLYYGSVVWDGLDKGLVNKLQRLQNRAARIITKTSWEVRSSDVLASLKWETLEKRRYNLKKNFMVKIMNDKAPKYMKDLFNKKEKLTSLALHDNENMLAVLFPKTDCLKHSFSYSGSVLWNVLQKCERIANIFTK